MSDDLGARSRLMPEPGDAPTTTKTAVRSRSSWWLLPALTWTLLYAWRPLRLGFYHDDWSLLLGCDGSILAEIYCTDPSRPGAPIIRWVFHSLVGVNPAAWQMVTIVSAFVAAATLMLLLQRMLRAGVLDASRAAWAAAIASSFYLAFPWMLGVAWVTGTSPNVATIFFNLSMLVWFARWPLAARLLASIAFFACASLIYESYWFVFIPWAGLLLLSGCLPRKELAFLVGGLAGAQLVLIGFNRLIALLGIGANKSIDPNWLHTLAGAWPTIIGGLRDIYGVTGRYIFAAMLVALSASLMSRVDIRRSLAAFGLISMGIALSFVLFAVAGYVVQLTGLFARTSLVLSWWLAVAASLGAAHAFELPARRRIFAGATGLILLLMLAGGTLAQSSHWIDSWTGQQDILAKLPRKELMAAPASSFLIIETPQRRETVGTFGGWWDISAAIWMTAPDVARHLAGNGPISSPIALVNNGLKRIRMTSTDVTESLCETSAPVADFRSNQILLWRYPGHTIEVVSAEAVIGCDFAQ
jgi:hypothetical protein